MNTRPASRIILIAVCLASAGLWWREGDDLPRAAAAADDEYGSVTGQFVFDGEIPPRQLLVKKDDPTVKDSAICAAADLPSDELIIDPKSKGISNVFIYLPKAAKVHPKLKASANKQVIFDQKGCRFEPHALLVRTDQVVLVKSDDNCAHNTHTNPLRNQPVNFILPPKERNGTEIANRLPERRPTKIICDIHRWMDAYWLILDHPYAAITDTTGKFTIADLPAGEHEFWVWQEKAGDINKALKVTITAGKTIDLGVIKVPAAEFED